MKPIENASQAWRLFSVQIGALAVAWGSLPPDTQTAILSAIGVPSERVPAIIGALVILARLVAQK